MSVWGSEYVLCVGQFVAGFVGVSLCCVCESLVWVLGSEFVLCVGEYGAGLEEWVFDVCARVCSWFGGVSLCCVWDRLVRVWGSGFLLSVG